MNKLMNRLGVGILFVLTCGCDQLQINNVESASFELQKCLVERIEENDCDDKKENLEIEMLKSKQMGIVQNIIDASVSLGEKSVTGQPDDSIFNRVSKSLTRQPFYINPIKSNFLFYKTQCPDFVKNPSIERLLEKDAIDWYSQPRTMFQSFGYIITYPDVDFLFVRIAPPCNTGQSGKLQVDDEFPILVKEQLDMLSNGVYMKNVYVPGYKNIHIWVYETYEEADKKVKELTNKK